MRTTVRGKLLYLIVSFAFSASSFSVEERPIRILSIDGGGVRGIIPAVILEEIENELEKPISEVFDMIAGSSTGGLIAIALATPDKNGRPAQSAQEIVDFYINSGVTVFKHTWKHWFSSLGGFIGPRYDNSGLKRIFTKNLGDTMLSESLIPVLVTGYHIDGQVGVEFFSEDAKKFPLEKDCLIREAAMATAAAPVYFDAVDVKFAWGTLESVADGCIYKLNPAMLIYAQAKKLYPHRKLEVYSIGTGHSSAEDLTLASKGRGFWHWMTPALRHIYIGSNEADDSILNKLLNNEKEQNYFRVNVRIDRQHSGLDDVSRENMHYLYHKSLDILKSGMFKDMLERLKT